jgi:hypothetical protein
MCVYGEGGVRIVVCFMLSAGNIYRRSKYCDFSGTLNLLTPNDHNSGRTAPLTSKVIFYIFIQQI